MCHAVDSDRPRRGEATGDGGQLRSGLLHRATADGCPETTPHGRIRSSHDLREAARQDATLSRVAQALGVEGQDDARFGDVPVASWSSSADARMRTTSRSRHRTRRKPSPLPSSRTTIIRGSSLRDRDH